MFSEEQAEAWKSDEMFRLLVSGAKDYAIILLDDMGKVVRWNDGAKSIHGFIAEEIIGADYGQFFADEDIKAGKPEVELRLARIAGRFQDEGWRLRKDKSKFWASFELTALRDKEGTLTGFGTVVRDITDRKDAEDRLRKSEEMFRLLVLGVKDYAIMMLNTDGEVASWNEGAERIKGYSAEEILGVHCSKFYTKEDISFGKPSAELQIAAREGRLEVEGWRVRKDRSRFRAHVVLTALHDDAGRLVGFGTVTRDITLQKEAENALTFAKEQAEQASRFKSEFLANMSHEIRTPMNGIIGITNILLRSPLADKQHQNLTMLRDVGVSLLSVINDILDFSKVEAGKLHLEIAQFEPTNLVEGTGDFFAAQAKEANVALATYISPDIPKFLNGDIGRLRQILTNLTSNAIKFSSHGEVVIKATVDSTTNKTMTVRFDVIDTGVGISEEAIERIFDPFVQADGASNRKYAGTGLGLSISKRLVGLMGGSIGVNSQVGKGSNFWFTSPFDISSMPVKDPIPKFDGLHVLLVDDVPASRNLIELYLSQWKVPFASCTDLQSAIRMLTDSDQLKDSFSLVVLNLSNPIEQLKEPAPQLLAITQASQTAIILAYGLSDSQNDDGFLDQYFPRRISKPVKGTELAHYLRRLSKRDGQSTLTKIASIREEKEHHSGEYLDCAKKVLVVEDNQVNKRVIIMELEELGLNSEAVGNGVEALRALKEGKYDIVLMDCQMPEMDGFEATRLIRQAEKDNGLHIPIIAMTAQALDGDRERCLSAGMDDYLSKPIDPDLLLQSLQRWIPKQTNSIKYFNLQENKVLAGCVSENVNIEIPVSLVDLDYLKAKYNRNRLNELIQLFIESSGQLIGKIDDAIEKRDPDRLRKTSHELAGSCMMLRMTRMLEKARELEKLGQQVDWNEATKYLSKLRESFEATKEIVVPALK